jgi:hypothetical protein
VGEITECKGDNKKTWQIINEFLDKKRRQIKPIFVIDNERVTNCRVIANEFNKYFASIASNLNEVYSKDESHVTTAPSFTDYLLGSIVSSIYLQDCDCTEIKDIIN